jgi:hypothetical protein
VVTVPEDCRAGKPPVYPPYGRIGRASAAGDTPGPPFKGNQRGWKGRVQVRWVVFGSVAAIAVDAVGWVMVLLIATYSQRL